MKRVLTVLFGAAALTLAANRADAVSYGPELPGPKGGGFERWDANDDGVIDKAEFREMRKALNKQQAAKKSSQKGKRKARARDHRGGRDTDGAPLSGPKADRADRDRPPHRAPAMRDDDRGDRRGDMDRRTRRGAGRRGPAARGLRDGRGRRAGPDAGRRGSCCPGCDCARGEGCECQSAGPRGPRESRMDRGRGIGRGFHRGRGPGHRHHGLHRHADGMPPHDMPPFMHRHRGHSDRDFGMMGPGRRGHGRRFAKQHPRLARRIRELARRMLDRFEANEERFISPDDFPGRRDRFDRRDRGEDDRRPARALRRNSDRRQRDGAGRGHRDGGRRGRGRGMDDDRPRGPRGPDDEGVRGPRTNQTRAI